MSFVRGLCCIAGAAAFALAAAGDRVAADQTQLSPEVRRHIDELAHGALAHQHLASLSLAIAKDGMILYARSYGYRDVAKRLPATPQTVYNIASMSKQFAAACVMLLQQDGKLRIDDRLSQYLPDLPTARKITLRNLLNHTSGLPDYLDLISDNDLSPGRILAALKKAPLQFAPGSKYQYSNSNYILLGLVVQKASGLPYDDFVTRRIFRPLHLASTSIGTAPKDMQNGALGYTVLDGRLTPAAPQGVSQLDFPDGGVNSTAVDLAKWDSALDSGQVISKDLLRMMFTPGPHGAETTYTYGLGLGIDRAHGHREIAHQGEWIGYAGENATFPDDRFAVVLLSNTDGFNEELLARKIFALFFPPTLAQQAAELRSVSGERKTVTRAATAWLDELTAGSVDKGKMTADLARSTSDTHVAALRREIRSYGKLQRFVFVGRISDSSGVTDVYRLFYPAAIVSYSLSLNQSGKIQAFNLSRED